MLFRTEFGSINTVTPVAWLNAEWCLKLKAYFFFFLPLHTETIQEASLMLLNIKSSWRETKTASTQKKVQKKSQLHVAK